MARFGKKEGAKSRQVRHSMIQYEHLGHGNHMPDDHIPAQEPAPASPKNALPPVRLLARPIVQWTLLVLVLVLMAWTAWSVWSERGAGFCYNYMVVHNATLDQLCGWREGLKWSGLTGLSPATP